MIHTTHNSDELAPARRLTVGWPVVLLAVSATLALLFFAVPLAALAGRSLLSGAVAGALSNATVTRALWLSGLTTLITLGLTLLLGTPCAFLLARYSFPGRRLLDTLVDLPMVLPPAVAGLALLMTFGRRGVLGPPLSAVGVELAFTTAAVIIAQTFVAAPFYIRAARAGFAAVDPIYERVAATLGVPPWRVFWRVTVPLARPALLGGAVMTWARALGEFGATIMFAGNFSGRTQTMPLAIYQALESDLDAALTLSLILVVVSFAVLLAVRAITHRSLGDVGGA